jgi:hypothetical protein
MSIWKSLFGKKRVEPTFRLPERANIYYLICDVARFGKDTTRISLRRGNTWIRVWTYAKSSVEDIKTSINIIKSQYEIEPRNIIIDAD